MKGLEHLSGRKETLEQLDALAERTLKSLEDLPEISDEPAMAAARENLQTILADATMKHFSDWLHTDPIAMLENPRFFYIAAELYQKRRKN